jgi:spore coat polysaccharide biosynthesis predicted glycosyltransferase SpsG
LTPYTNPWNAVYKLALKPKRRQTMTTLQKPDGSLTPDLNETAKIMIDHLIPEDSHMDKDYHKRIRAQSKEPILTTDDREYTPAKSRTP